MSHERRDVVAVGLTGGIGAGKSTALAMFKELGALTVSADQVVHDLYSQSGSSAIVAARFGPNVLNGQGVVDRARLAEAVRGRPDELAWLEGFTHPRVADTIRRRIRSASPGTVVVCEVPLLFEAGYEDMFDLIVTVEAGSENRRRRSIHNFDIEQFSEFEQLQASEELRTAGSNLVFVNDGSLNDLREFVGQAYERAQTLLLGCW